MQDSLNHRKKASVASGVSAAMGASRLRNRLTLAAAILSFAVGATAIHGQAAATTPHQTGTVKSTGDHSLVLTTKAGQEFTITVTDSTKFLIVPPGSKDLKSATDGGLSDATPGDSAIVNGSAGDTGSTLNAVRVILMKSGAIAQAHEAQASAWTQGSGGIVKSANGGTIVMSSGMKTITVQATPQTIVRRYSDSSVRFEDAVVSTPDAIRPGDQMRVRGTRSADGNTITADEIVTGSFRNFSGIISSIDSAASTISLKDLATKRVVTVAVTPNSDLHRLDPQMATRIAMGMRGGAAGARPAGAPAGGPGGSEGPRGPGGAGGPGAGARAGADLSRMLARLPTETLGGLKAGEAVMIVASAGTGEGAKGSVITLLVGVDPILTAPSGETTTLSPWSVGGGGEGEGGMGGGATP